MISFLQATPFMKMRSMTKIGMVIRIREMIDGLHEVETVMKMRPSTMMLMRLNGTMIFGKRIAGVDPTREERMLRGSCVREFEY
jgi:hypothetical protein